MFIAKINVASSDRNTARKPDWDGDAALTVEVVDVETVVVELTSKFIGVVVVVVVVVVSVVASVVAVVVAVVARPV